MSVRRVMGIETEYGILQPGRPLANPMLLSSHVVAVHAAARDGAGRRRAGTTTTRTRCTTPGVSASTAPRRTRRC
ncbi:hypothetical protein [Cellulomonas soli]